MIKRQVGRSVVKLPLEHLCCGIGPEAKELEGQIVKQYPELAEDASQWFNYFRDCSKDNQSYVAFLGDVIDSMEPEIDSLGYFEKMFTERRIMDSFPRVAEDATEWFRYFHERTGSDETYVAFLNKVVIELLSDPSIETIGCFEEIFDEKYAAKIT